jgi:RNA polymerase sigma-70 factor (ECF subfamily)
MPPPPPLSEEELLRHARSLRALARRLVRDQHAAEDVVQDALVVALERPPRSRESVGGWLAAVVRSVASKRGRGDARRLARERASARPERHVVPDGAERVEALRRLTGAVASLDEPYRTVVLLRWLEGLSPTRIARRRGAPVATVKSQLQRGLAKLRTELDRDGHGEPGSWVPGLATLSGVGAGGGGAAAAGLLTGGIVMAGNAKLAVAAAVLVSAGIGLLLLGPGGEPHPAAPERGDEAAAPRPNAVLLSEERSPEPLAPETAELREAATVASATPSERAAPLPPTHLLELEGTVVDPWDRPAPGADVWVALPGMPPNRVAKTDRAGRFRAAFRAHLPAIEVWLAAGNLADGQSGMRRVSLTEGAPLLAHLRLGGAPPPPLLADGISGGFRVRLLRNVASGGSRWADAPPLLGDEDERLRFDAAAPAMLDHREMTGEFDVVQYRGTGGLDTKSYAIELQAIVEDLDGDDPGEGAAVIGVVTRANGVPAARVLVGTTGDDARGARWTWTDDEGHFALTELEPGDIELRAGGGDSGRASTTMRLAASSASTWEPELDRGLEVRGTLLDDESSHRRGFWIELSSSDPSAPWEDGCEVDPQGQFAIPNCPSGPLTLSVFPREGRRHLPALVREGVLAGGAELELLLRDDELPGGRIELTVVDADGEPHPGLEVRALDPETGRGTHLVHGGGGRYRLRTVRAGRYLLEGVDEAHGGVALGEVWVDGRGPATLGPVTATPPGHVTIDLSAALGLRDTRWAIVAVRPEAPVQVRSSEWAGETTHTVGAGLHELWFQAEDLALLRAPLDLAPGQEVTVRVPLDLAPEIELVGRRAGGSPIEGGVPLELRDLDSGDVVLRTTLTPRLDGAVRATVRLPFGAYHATAGLPDGERAETTIAHDSDTRGTLAIEVP